MLVFLEDTLRLMALLAMEFVWPAISPPKVGVLKQPSNQPNQSGFDVSYFCFLSGIF